VRRSKDETELFINRLNFTSEKINQGLDSAQSRRWVKSLVYDLSKVRDVTFELEELRDSIKRNQTLMKPYEGVDEIEDLSEVIVKDVDGDFTDVAMKCEKAVYINTLLNNHSFSINDFTFQELLKQQTLNIKVLLTGSGYKEGFDNNVNAIVHYINFRLPSLLLMLLTVDLDNEEVEILWNSNILPQTILYMLQVDIMSYSELVKLLRSSISKDEDCFKQFNFTKEVLSLMKKSYQYKKVKELELIELNSSYFAGQPLYLVKFKKTEEVLNSNYIFLTRPSIEGAFIDDDGVDVYEYCGYVVNSTNYRSLSTTIYDERMSYRSDEVIFQEIHMQKMMLLLFNYIERCNNQQDDEKLYEKLFDIFMTIKVSLGNVKLNSKQASTLLVTISEMNEISSVENLTKGVIDFIKTLVIGRTGLKSISTSFSTFYQYINQYSTQ